VEAFLKNVDSGFTGFIDPKVVDSDLLALLNISPSIDCVSFNIFIPVLYKLLLQA
jgi:hypothetical protein